MAARRTLKPQKGQSLDCYMYRMQCHWIIHVRVQCMTTNYTTVNTLPASNERLYKPSASRWVETLQTVAPETPMILGLASKLEEYERGTRTTKLSNVHGHVDARAFTHSDYIVSTVVHNILQVHGEQCWVGSHRKCRAIWKGRWYVVGGLRHSRPRNAGLRGLCLPSKASSSRAATGVPSVGTASGTWRRGDQTLQMASAASQGR